MPKASVTRLIDQRKDKLIEFVLDIEKYPEFIPFCDSAKVYERNDNGQITNIIADLTIGKGPFKDTYKSDVVFNKKEDSIFVKNIEGPLNHLSNNWKFADKNNGITEVIFDIDFEIKNKFLNSLMVVSFQFGLEKIADGVGGAVETLVRAVAPEIAPKRINILAPGTIDTPMVAFKGAERDTYYAKATADNIIPRAGTPEEAAQGILFLIQNDFVTGTTVDVDGGWLLS